MHIVIGRTGILIEQNNNLKISDQKSVRNPGTYWFNKVLLGYIRSGFMVPGWFMVPGGFMVPSAGTVVLSLWNFGQTHVRNLSCPPQSCFPMTLSYNHTFLKSPLVLNASDNLWSNLREKWWRYTHLLAFNRFTFAICGDIFQILHSEPKITFHNVHIVDISPYSRE